VLVLEDGTRAVVGHVEPAPAERPGGAEPREGITATADPAELAAGAGSQ
jgi:hypothetical protein